MEENIRFIQILDELKQKGEVADYVSVSTVLGTNKAGISDIKSGRKKLSIEMLRRLKSSYPNVNLEWIIMGVGEPFASNKSEPENNSLSSTFINKIAEQAEEIGRLREQIEQFKRGRGHSASDANTSEIANVG